MYVLCTIDWSYGKHVGLAIAIQEVFVFLRDIRVSFAPRRSPPHPSPFSPNYMQ
jgi:hypothetical protein